MAKQSKRDVEKHMPMVGMDHRETDTENFENGVKSMVDSPGASPPPPPITHWQSLTPNIWTSMKIYSSKSSKLDKL